VWNGKKKKNKVISFQRKILKKKRFDAQL
jgi:hypothetical protein